jgi:hypothetical protein
MIYKNKIGVLAVAAMLLTGIVANVAAQQIKKAPVRSNGAVIIVPPPLPVGTLSGDYSSKVNAIELSLGDTQYAVGQTFGWTSYGTTSGDLNGYMFMSMNYTVPPGLVRPQLQSESAIAPPQPVYQTSKVTGGSWSKLIFVKGKYVGSVYGRIVDGDLTWDLSDSIATMQLVLVADNGTAAFLGNKGKGTFQGTFDRATGAGNIFGELTLSF